ncbi:ABC transporter permease [Lentibacter algarum]|uniref:ABC transporter permease n=1 Tax=Lentibacter algarum TaxID=576131 RepID=UPI00339D922E
MQHARTIVALVLREMATRYGKSPGGYLWALLEPLGGIIILSLAFSLLVRNPSLGNSFLLFYATGYLPFQMFQSVTQLSQSSLNYSRALLQYPNVSWIDAVTARVVLAILTGALVSLIILTAIIEYADQNSTLRYGYIFQAFASAALLGLGIGMVNSVVIGLLPVWRSIWGIMMRPLLLASGVLYIYEDLPRAAQDLIWYNPLLHSTALARAGFFQTYTPQHVSLVYIYGISAILIAAGLMLLRRFYLTILEK